MLFTSSRREKWRNISYEYKNRRCINFNSHVNYSESNHFSTSKSDNNIGNSIIPPMNIQTESSFNTLITLQTETDTQSIISINHEIIYEKYISEALLSHHSSAEVIYYTCDGNGNNLLDIEEEADVTSIHYINANIYISINDDKTFIHRYYTPILSSKNHEDVSSRSEYYS